MHLADNLILNTDSYKASHWLQYPPGVDATSFYLESRGGVYERTLFFGLQSILKEYLGKPVTSAMIDDAEKGTVVIKRCRANGFAVRPSFGFTPPAVRPGA